ARTDGSGAMAVRMALHTGDIAPEEGSYHGPVLAYLSRLLSAAYAGQILCSETTASLVRQGAKSEVHTVDLGLYRLPEASEPVRIFQAEYPDMPVRQFPPPRLPAAYTGNLP